MNETNKGTSAFQEILTYMFKDPNWISKILLGALFGIIPILNFVTFGYALRVIHSVKDDVEFPLPEWGKDFGKYFVDGILMAVISFLYGIPAWILSGIAGGIGGSSSSAFATLIAVLFGLLALVYGIALVFLVQAAYINFAIKGNFGAAFEFGRVIEIVKQHAARLLFTVILAVIVGILIAIVTLVLGIIPCIGWLLAWIISFAAAFYVLLVLAYNCGIVAKSA